MQKVVFVIGCFVFAHASPNQGGSGHGVKGGQGGPDFCCQELIGSWQNQLGSLMKLSQCQHGDMRGDFNNSVSNTAGLYPLAGTYTIGEEDSACIVGWSISWNNAQNGNSKSATVWSGLYYKESGKIFTQWITTRFKPIESFWETTWTNHDEFFRVPTQ